MAKFFSLDCYLEILLEEILFFAAVLFIILILLFLDTA